MERSECSKFASAASPGVATSSPFESKPEVPDPQGPSHPHPLRLELLPPPLVAAPPERLAAAHRLCQQPGQSARSWNHQRPYRLCSLAQWASRRQTVHFELLIVSHAQRRSRSCTLTGWVAAPVSDGVIHYAYKGQECYQLVAGGCRPRHCTRPESFQADALEPVADTTCR